MARSRRERKSLQTLFAGIAGAHRMQGFVWTLTITEFIQLHSDQKAPSAENAGALARKLPSAYLSHLFNGV